MLRKAVLMPKWAILLTIIGAVAGQQVCGGGVGVWGGGWVGGCGVAVLLTISGAVAGQQVVGLGWGAGAVAV